MLSFQSFVRLGLAFARVLWKKAVHKAPELPRFVHHYEADGIVLFERGESEVLAGASRCVACTRCDAEALVRGCYEALGPQGPMGFVLGVSRHSGEHDLAELDASVSKEDLSALTESCPVRVPFVPLVALVRRRAAALQKVRHEGVRARLV